VRAALILLPACALSAPASAQAAAPAAPLQPQEIRISPESADRVADAMQSLSKAILDLKIGGIQAALEGRQPTPADRHLTVRDLARRNNPNLDRDIERQIASARPTMEQGIRALNQTLPEVAQDLQRAQQSIERAISNLPDPNYPRR
jgi:ABC-type transporter Mla subunit MlaD